MIKSKHTYLFSLLLAFLIINLSSCSTDKDDPIVEITVSTSDFSITMDENPAKGQIIGTVEGSTNQGSVTFSITEQSPAGAFSIDATSGELEVLNGALYNFDLHPIITGTVKVANGSVFKNASVTITLKDGYVEKIYDGDVILRSQLEVNEFGANNYTKITGFLIIGKLDNEGYSDIYDLTPLLSLKHVEDHFYIQYNQILTTTIGLENIQFLGNNFGVFDNPSLVTLVGLDNIESIKGMFFISKNASLSNLDGIRNISTVGNSFTISENDVLPNLEWFSNLISVGGNFALSNNPLITNVNDLSNLSNIGGGLLISANPLLSDLFGFENLTGTINYLHIHHSKSLVKLDGLSNITIVRSISFYSNPLLEDINALLNTTSLAHTLSIYNNGSLKDLNGLSNLTSIGDEMTIQGNSNLTSLNGLNNLLNVSSTMDIINNVLLSDFCALQNLFIIGTSNRYRVWENAYNPTKQDIIDGNCKI